MAVDEALALALSKVVEARQDEIEKQSAYYHGDLPSIRLSDRTIPLYDVIINQARSPWGGLVIDAAAERLEVTGFRVVTSDSDDEDVEADETLWDIWQASDAHTMSQVAFRDALTHGVAYVLLERGDDLPVISFEHPSTTATIPTPGGRQVFAAIKTWVEGSVDVAVVWSGSEVSTFTRNRSSSNAKWTPAPARAESVGVVPVFPMANRPDLLGNHFSDLDGLYLTLDRVAQGIADRITTQIYSAAKVRYLLGVEPEVDADGEPTEGTLRLATDKLLLIENENAKAGVFDASDLRQFIELNRADVSALAAISRLPSYLLSGDLVNVSAEALASLMQSLASRVEQRQAWFSSGLSKAARLALSLAGDERVNDPRTRIEVLWADPIPRSLDAMAAAASTLVSSNVLSSTGAQEYALGLSPTDIEKQRQYRRIDALTQQGVDDINALFTAPPAPIEETVPPSEAVTTGG